MRCGCIPLAQYEFKTGDVLHKLCTECGLHYEVWIDTDGVKKARSSVYPKHLLDQQEKTNNFHAFEIMENMYIREIFKKC